MTRALTQLLREQEEKHKAARPIVEEWRASVQQLFHQIRGWLAEADPDGIIQIEEHQQELREEGLGAYKVPRLDLRVFGNWIGIIPKARNTVVTARPPQRPTAQRATGRVDITDEVRRYILFRLPADEGGDVWFIDDLRSEPKPLDQQAFEAALLSYLR